MYENYREIPSPLQVIWDVLDDHIATRPSVLRMVVRGVAFLGITGILIGPYALADLARRRHLKRWIAKAWFISCTAICGLTVKIKGVPTENPATLHVANHVSYLDIIVLGAIMDARFVAKADVADWPLFGLLARMANTLFVTRDRARALKDSGRIANALEDRERLILFPEGTSSNGRAVLPFKSALFSAVDPRRVNESTEMQPVSIAYSDYADGRPLRGELTDLYAWYGDMTLFGHLMTVFGLKGATVEVTFQPSVRPAAYPDRKALAKSAERAVRDGLNASLRV